MIHKRKTFKNFKPVEINDDIAKTLRRINENLKLILDLLCDLRFTKPKKQEENEISNRKIVKDYIGTIVGICLIKDDDYCNQDLNLITEKFGEKYPHLRHVFRRILQLLSEEFKDNGLITSIEYLAYDKINKWLDTKKYSSFI